MHTKFKLPYSFDALEPIIDKETMQVHYEKHYNTYLTNLNENLKHAPFLMVMNIFDLMAQVEKVNSKLQNSVRNNGGGVINHNLYWEILTPGGRNKPEGKLLEQINKDFESFDNLKSDMILAGKNRFGSGWVWLVKDGSKLKVCSTANQDNPLMGEKIAGCSGIPILGIDVWEHAYYLKYQNKRDEYLNKIWDIINFEKVEEIYEMIESK